MGISITPAQYYNIAQGKEINKIGMYFRDGSNVNKGFGFRNSILYFDVQSDQPFVTISPANFNADTEITVTFNANQGNKELTDASKIYFHSGVGVVNTASPEGSAWNKVVGNWGQDDGKGLMTKVPGQSDKWQIKLIPRAYYGLTGAEFPYWIAAVFRSADGGIRAPEHLVLLTMVL
ncbi:MAG: hypothetical protein IPO92_08715 [Saprospiraceae bacterium]|nr:hypothetical protein [Saprospiraceae bacterium]